MAMAVHASALTRLKENDMTERTIWYAVCDLHNPEAEPFMVVSIDTSAKREDGGVEGKVVSLHWLRESAERVVREFNEGPLS